MIDFNNTRELFLKPKPIPAEALEKHSYTYTLTELTRMIVNNPKSFGARLEEARKVISEADIELAESKELSIETAKKLYRLYKQVEQSEAA